jgi:lipopolysaccharide/colanic/teichoic acid biosynthesis glycosyltransferase
MDLYYVNNWSVWLDLYILSKTVFAVFFRHGAR